MPLTRFMDQTEGNHGEKV